MMGKRKGGSGNPEALILALGILIGVIVTLAGQEILREVAAPAIQVPIEGSRAASVGVVAVAAETGEGIVGTANVEVVPGRGRTLISTNPFIEPDTQDSVQVARAAAERVTGLPLSDIDIIATFELPGNEGGVVGGPSAGLPVALAIVSALSDRPLAAGVVATGTIDADGFVGPVGGIIEKAEAAGLAGNSLFLVPKGQGNIRYYEREVETERQNGFVVRRVSYVPQTLDLSNYTQQWNMTALEVGTLWEAAEAAIPDAVLTERRVEARAAGEYVCGVWHTTTDA